MLGTKCLADILSEREKIANWMEQTLGRAQSATLGVLICQLFAILHAADSWQFTSPVPVLSFTSPIFSDEATDPWGVKVERVEM